MMYGTVWPLTVNVATSSGGLSGLYGCSFVWLVDLYLYAYVAGRLHWLSSEPAGQVHGCTCGPANSGPPCGWLVSVIFAPVPSGSFASTVFGPSSRPVTRPRVLCSDCAAKAELSSGPPTSTVTLCASSPVGTVISSRASLSTTRSARLERTLIVVLSAAVAVDATSASNRTAATVAASSARAGPFLAFAVVGGAACG